MKRLNFILIFIILSAYCYSQSRKSNKNPNDCIYLKKYSKIERESFELLEKASFIKFVSYDDSSYMNKLESNHKWIVFAEFTDSIIKIPRTSESVLLSSLQRDTLTDVLYNNFYNGVSNISKITQCYFPRNAIVFYTDEKKAFACIEVCFECNRVKFIPESTGKRINMCNQTVFKLKTLFKNFGITYGLEDEMKDR